MYFTTYVQIIQRLQILQIFQPVDINSVYLITPQEEIHKSQIFRSWYLETFLLEDHNEAVPHLVEKIMEDLNVTYCSGILDLSQ